MCSRRQAVVRAVLAVALALSVLACDEAPVPKPKRADNHAVAEVAGVFDQLKAAEARALKEDGQYLGTGSESELVSEIPAALRQLGARPAAPLACRYAVVAGKPDSADGMGPLGRQLFTEGVPPRDWYYLLADCGGFRFLKRYDSPEIVEKKHN